MATEFRDEGSKIFHHLTGSRTDQVSVCNDNAVWDFYCVDLASRDAIPQSVEISSMPLWSPNRCKERVVHIACSLPVSSVQNKLSHRLVILPITR